MVNGLIGKLDCDILLLMKLSIHPYPFCNLFSTSGVATFYSRSYLFFRTISDNSFPYLRYRKVPMGVSKLVSSTVLLPIARRRRPSFRGFWSYSQC